MTITTDATPADLELDLSVTLVIPGDQLAALAAEHPAELAELVLGANARMAAAIAAPLDEVDVPLEVTVTTVATGGVTITRTIDEAPPA